jgi:hypothetical protein
LLASQSFFPEAIGHNNARERGLAVMTSTRTMSMSGATKQLKELLREQEIDFSGDDQCEHR